MTKKMAQWKTGWLIGVLLWLGLAKPVVAQLAMTHVQDTVYHADGSVAHGSVLVTWPAFTAAGGQNIAKGSTSITLSTEGMLSVNLAPNAGANPMGTYYTAVYHLEDGSVNREYWVVPVSAAAVTLQSVKASVLPTAVAMQTATKQYVDQSIQRAALGSVVGDGTSVYVEKSGDTMTGALVLPGDPTTALQAATKGYVDSYVTALQGGLAQKVSLVPSASQVVTQPSGTELTANRMNGVLNVAQFKSPGVINDGVVNTLAQPDCVNGCEAVIERGYAGLDRFSAVAPMQTHGVDHRGGMQSDYFINPHNPGTGGLDAGEQITVVQTQSASDVKVATGSGSPSSFGLRILHQGLAGGNNILPQNVTSAAPYFKSNFTALSLEGTYYTEGQHVLDTHSTNCYGVGDCLIGSRFITSSGGFRDNADEGTHGYDFVISEDARVFQGTCSIGCTPGSTNLKITATRDAGTQGEGRFLLNMNSAKILTGGSLTGGNRSGSPFPTAVFTGTSFAVSTFFMLNDAIVPQATNMAPGTVTATIKTSGVPDGYQSDTTAAPSTNGIACVVDLSPGGSFSANNYETAPYSVVNGTHLQLTLNKPHAASATVAIGGLCGYGLEQTVDTVAGIRQVFPVVGSISSTSLYYASGLTPIVASPFSTSAFQNINLAIASIHRDVGTVTVTTSGNMPADLNGLTLTVAGVSDSSYNGNFVVTTTGPNTLTYLQAGANSSSSGGTVGLLTGEYKLYPMAEVLGVVNTATMSVDGTMQLAPNTVAWDANDAVEEPHYYQQKVGGDLTSISQQTPRPVTQQQNGIKYQGNVGPGMRGWLISNGVPATNYLGNGGLHAPPDFGIQIDGTWNTSMIMQAGERSAIAIACNSHGCNKWNSGYNLLEMVNSVGNGAADTVAYAPQTSTMTFNMRGTQYSLSPAALTAGTIHATTIHVGGGSSSFAVDASGNISASSLFLKVNAMSFSATPVFSATSGANRIVLAGNVTSSTIADGTDGQHLCMNIVQDTTGGWAFLWPANMRGTMTVGTLAGKRNHQCFTYYADDHAWIAESQGVTNQ